MVRDFVLWGARQMRAVLRRFLLRGSDRGDALVIAAQPLSPLPTLHRRGRETLLGRFSVNGAATPDPTPTPAPGRPGLSLSR
jgi:hypothetical protein